MKPRTFHITTFGCQMNVSDSDWLAQSLLARGFTPASWEEAQIYILNTCSVRDKPEQKVYSEIGRIRSHSGNSPAILVCVGGCVAQQVGAKLFGRFSQVRLLFGADGIASAPEAIARLAEDPKLRLSFLDFSREYEEREQAPPPANVAPAAFVNIMQGCDNFCAYCIVPYVRGRQKSRAPQAILDECRILLEHGAREITLLGQNVNSFGQDERGSGLSFTELLYQVAALPNLARLRFITPHPKDLAPELILAFAELHVLTPRLHLPLQSGSDRILELMGRRYDKARYWEIVENLRRARPDLHLSTDVIVGFPGETEEDFSQTLEFMQAVGFVGSFSFVYSDRPGTRASLLPGKIERPVALERLARLQGWQYDHAWKILQSMTGEMSEVLLEEPSPRAEDGSVTWQGREPHGHSVNVGLSGDEPEGGWKGKIVPVKITGAAVHSLRAEQVGEAG